MKSFSLFPLIMALKNENFAMIKRRAEKIQISAEEDLLKSFMSEELLKEGRDKYKIAIWDFLKVAKNELEKLVLKLPNFQIKNWEGVISFCLQNTTVALKKLVNDIEDWVLRYIEALEDEDEWIENFSLLKSLHKMMVRRLSDLSKDNNFENYILKNERSKIKTKISEFEIYKIEVPKSKSNKLSLKKKK